MQRKYIYGRNKFYFIEDYNFDKCSNYYTIFLINSLY